MLRTFFTRTVFSSHFKHAQPNWEKKPTCVVREAATFGVMMTQLRTPIKPLDTIVL